VGGIGPSGSESAKHTDVTLNVTLPGRRHF
jgi:hypothetical protein